MTSQRGHDLLGKTPERMCEWKRHTTEPYDLEFFHYWKLPPGEQAGGTRVVSKTTKENIFIILEWKSTCYSNNLNREWDKKKMCQQKWKEKGGKEWQRELKGC